MHRLRSLLLLVITSLVLTSIPAHAQDDAIVGDLAALDGIEASVQRLWLVDFSTMLLTGTPVPEGGLPAGLAVLQAGVSRFDSNASATAAFAKLVAQAQAEQVAVATEIGNQGEMFSEVNADLGDESFVYLAAVPDQQAVVRVVFARNGAYLLMAFGFASDVEATQRVDDLAAYLVETGEASTDPESFVANGTSTGGLWGFMPPAGDPLLAGLVAEEDEIIFPAPTGQ